MRPITVISALILTALALGSAQSDAPKGSIRIFIHTDMEGVSGIDSFEMIQRDGGRYRECCERMMADANAAVEGAFQGGADEVVVLDNHGSGRNFIPELLDKRAAHDPRENGKWWGGLDDTFSASFFVGAHSMAGTTNGFLEHTMNSTTWHDYSINGRRFGELGMWGVVTGHLKVPVVMVSGDAAACSEAKTFYGPIETAVVKAANGRNKAKCLPDDMARERIREAARRSVALIERTKPFNIEMPMEIMLELNRSDYCETDLKHPGVERLDARTIRKVADDPLGLFP
jgi:D-amino peptidase